MKKTYHSPESLFKDPDYTSRARAADLATANAYLNSTLSVSLDELQAGQTPLARLKPERQPSLKKGECLQIRSYSPKIPVEVSYQDGVY